jgi:hypothetical protein
MPFLPQVHAQRRAPRVRFEETTPVVLRYPDGRRFSGELQVISVTGGLLNVRPPLQQGSVVKLMFLAKTGSVLGSAQMLTPVAWNQQPFRFIALHDDDQMRLHAAIQSSLPDTRHKDAQRSREREQMESHRAW